MTILLTWLWQGLAIAGVTTAILWAMPRLGASTRHRTWWAALGAVLAVPLVLVSGGAGVVGTQLTLSAAGVPALPAVVLPAVPEWAIVVLAGFWALAALSGLARILLGCRAVARMKRDSSPFDAGRLAKLPLWSSRAAVAGRHAELRVSDAITGACALGFRRPVILVGEQLVRALDDQALDHVLMHEQAHLDRYDDFTQLLQASVRAVAGLHPAVWWLSRQIDFDREAACDSLVVARTGAARSYATALLQAAVTTGGARAVPAIVPGATARASALRRRVARLFDPRRIGGERLAAFTPAVTFLPIAGLLACVPLAPLVAMADSGRQTAQAPMVLAAAAPASAPRPVAPVGAVPLGMNTFARAGARPGMRWARSTVALAQQPVTAAPAASPGPIDAQAPLESRALPVTMDAPAVIAGVPSSGVQTQPTTTTGGRWQALATAPANAATDVATTVASGAGRSSVSLGRAFTRAAKSIAERF
jgi:beta-lactamase regulating signal transducer with metallopeptidase domain